MQQPFGPPKLSKSDNIDPPSLIAAVISCLVATGTFHRVSLITSWWLPCGDKRRGTRRSGFNMKRSPRWKSITHEGTEQGVTPITISVRRAEGLLTGREGRSEGDTVSERERERERDKLLERKYRVRPCVYEARFACPAPSLDWFIPPIFLCLTANNPLSNIYTLSSVSWSPGFGLTAQKTCFLVKNRQKYTFYCSQKL